MDIISLVVKRVKDGKDVSHILLLPFPNDKIANKPITQIINNVPITIKWNYVNDSLYYLDDEVLFSTEAINLHTKLTIGASFIILIPVVHRTPDFDLTFN